jgi:hypothetical protein
MVLGSLEVSCALHCDLVRLQVSTCLSWVNVHLGLSRFDVLYIVTGFDYRPRHVSLHGDR